MRPAFRLALCSVFFALALRLSIFAWSHQVSSTAKGLLTIPTESTGYGLVLVQARVNNSQPLWFALDSGASFPFVINSSRARALQLKLQDHFTLRGGAGAGTLEADMTKGILVNISGMDFRDETAAVFDLSSVESIAGRRLDGLIGRELLTRFVVEIDYTSNKINLYDPEKYTYSGAGEIISLGMKGDYLFVAGKIDMPDRPAVEGRFLVDTGGGFVTLVLNAPFARSRNLPAPTRPMVLDRSLLGLGGDIRLLVTRATCVALGKLLIREPIVYVSQDSGGALASSEFDGLIGGELLRKFNLIFDYPRGRLILEPNANYAARVEYDMSGIRLRTEGSDFRTFRVYQILENSPAARAGLREGDVITAIDAAPAKKFSLDQIYQMFKQEGREYELSLRRRGQTVSLKIKMGRMI